jgi:alpha-glucosidase
VARTPMPWEPVPGLGFTTAERAWLPFGDRPAADTAAVQRDDPASPLSAYRRLLAVRRTLLPLPEDLAWLTDEGPVLAYRRGGVVVAANTADTPAELDVPAGLMVRFSTRAAREGSPAGARLALEPAEAVVLGVPG